MKCPNCEVELPENSKFCAACGVKIENGETHSEGATNITTEESSKAVKTSVKEKVPEETIQSTATKLWNSLDLFYKVAAIVTFAISILLIVSICIGKAWPIVFSVLQLGGVVVAVLLHKNIIKLNYDWVKFVALGIVMLLTVFNIFSYSWGADNNRTQGDGTSQDVQKYDVSIRVECVQNLIFSKYDVKVLVDGDNQGKVEHGGDKDFAMKLIAGEHTITFRSSESSSVKGEVKLTVDCDTKAAYKISCHSDNVAVETLYVEQLRDLADNEAKVTAGASEYAYKNYQEVKTAFESAGFTNIKCVAVYDIVWGLTEEESVESVSIGGNKDFKQGEIFAKDAEVVITYHMPEDADPTVISMPQNASDYIGQDFSVVEQELRKLGFTNITTEEIVTRDTQFKQHQIYSISINDNCYFKKSDEFKNDNAVHIKYYIMGEPETLTMTASSASYVGKDANEVKTELENLGFLNVQIKEVETTDRSKKDGAITEIAADSNGFETGAQIKDNVEIIIVCWKVKKPEVVLPKKGSKLDKDYDSKGSSTVYYINVDGQKNKPTVTKWGKATVTDGVAEYLDYLKELGFTIKITETKNSEPHSGFHLYETKFKVSNSEISWTMYLCIQDEDFVEYELDINLN